jgi:NAD(P)-dependent dehydrogenase (short-subunit alcohol dehydrogenase family)
MRTNFTGDTMIEPVPSAPDSLRDRVILVTGAGSGLGREAALAYALHGATIALLGRNEKKLEAVYDEIVAAGGPEPAIFPFDLAAADDAGFERLAGTISYHLKRLDGILHSAAAFFSLTPLHLQSLEQWNTLLKVNVAAPFALTKACLPLLQASPDASVIFTGESHGHRPAAYWGGYAVSKSGLEALATIWSEELEQTANVRVNTLIPGPVKSPLRRKTHPGENPDALPQPQDLMPWYVWLMGPDSREVRGQIIECARNN